MHGPQVTIFLSENWKGKGYLGDIVFDERIILKWILKYVRYIWTGLNWLWVGSTGGLL
jgi:hypothetical protein